MGLGLSVSGQVFGPDGVAAVGASVGSIWFFGQEKQARFRCYDAAVSGPGGAFSYVLPDAPLPRTIFVLDAAGENGAFLTLTPGSAREGIAIRLAPLRAVRYRVRIDGLSETPPSPFVRVGPAGAPACVTIACGPTGEILLPNGALDLYATAPETAARTVSFRVGPGGGDISVALRAGAIARNYGRPALPITLTDSIGLPPGKTAANWRLSDYRGKWVLIEFWGHWCDPCVRESLPELARFYRESADARERFEVFALHAADIGTRDALAPFLARLQATLWENRTLPFPILLDGSGKTVARWEVTLYPQTVLIDPSGNFVRDGSLKTLRTRLESNSRASRASVK